MDADEYLAMVEYHEQQDREYRAKLTPQQLIDYRKHVGEIADCPKCGTENADVEHDAYADMVGETYVTIFQCCGYAIQDNSAIERDENGKVVDIG